MQNAVRARRLQICISVALGHSHLCKPDDVALFLGKSAAGLMLWQSLQFLLSTVTGLSSLTCAASLALRQACKMVRHST